MLESNRIVRIGTAALGAAVLCVSLLISTARVAGAQTPATDIQSVGVGPTESKPDDPNAGAWFVFNLAPGQTGTTKARITNPADVPQTVKLYLADLAFTADGTPSIPNTAPSDVGAWGHFTSPTLTVPPRTQVDAPFSLSVPQAAEPGDHIGVVVAESEPVGTNLKVVKRIATRLYVTVPGDATKSFTVLKVTKHADSGWFPHSITVKTLLRNTGRIRLHPKVTVAGHQAKGADPMLARSVEGYVGKVHVPWYGGPVNLNVKIATDAGTKTVSSSMFVIPWGNLALIPLAVLALLALRGLWRLRTRKMRRLQADLRRLEKLVADKQAADVPAPVVEADPVADRVRDIRAGLKRARRNGAQEPLQRLAMALHDTGEDALDDLLVALERAEPPARQALVAAAASYGPARLEAARDVPADVLAAAAPAPAAPARRARQRFTPAGEPGDDRVELDAGTASGSAETPRPAGSGRRRS